MSFGQAVADERHRRRWSMRELGDRARLSASTILGIEAGRPASIDAYGRVAAVLGIRLEVVAGPSRRARDSTDIVHSAMGEIEAALLTRHGYETAVDHPYQHYQFAGRADVLAWSAEHAALLHIENRTRFSDLQQVAGSFNAKCQYMAAVAAKQLDLASFRSETHVIVGLWSAEVIHAIRRRPATFGALAPHDEQRFAAWLRGQPPGAGASRSLVLLDPFASGRQRAFVGLEAVLDGVRPRVRDHREAAERVDRSR